MWVPFSLPVSIYNAHQWLLNLLVEYQISNEMLSRNKIHYTFFFLWLVASGVAVDGNCSYFCVLSACGVQRGDQSVFCDVLVYSCLSDYHVCVLKYSAV